MDVFCYTKQREGTGSVQMFIREFDVCINVIEYPWFISKEGDDKDVININWLRR